MNLDVLKVVFSYVSSDTVLALMKLNVDIFKYLSSDEYFKSRINKDLHKRNLNLDLNFSHRIMLMHYANKYQFVTIYNYGKVYFLESYTHECVKCLSNEHIFEIIQPCFEIFQDDDIMFFEHQLEVLKKLCDDKTLRDFLTVHLAISERYPRVHKILLKEFGELTGYMYFSKDLSRYMNLSNSILTFISGYNISDGLSFISGRLYLESCSSTWVKDKKMWKINIMVRKGKDSYEYIKMYCGKHREGVRRFEWVKKG